MTVLLQSGHWPKMLLWKKSFDFDEYFIIQLHPSKKMNFLYLDISTHCWPRVDRVSPKRLFPLFQPLVHERNPLIYGLLVITSNPMWSRWAQNRQNWPNLNMWLTRKIVKMINSGPDWDIMPKDLKHWPSLWIIWVKRSVVCYKYFL